MAENNAPEIMTELRKDIVRVPEVIQKLLGSSFLEKRFVPLFLLRISRLSEIQTRMQ